MTQVTTYVFAYVANQISLCRRHEAEADTECPLGPVSHGLHWGVCNMCEADASLRAAPPGELVADAFGRWVRAPSPPLPERAERHKGGRRAEGEEFDSPGSVAA